MLSEGHTAAEMDRKLCDYFQAGTRLVWYIDPRTRTAKVYTAVDNVTLVREEGELDGADVLPGFHFRLEDLFQRAERGSP